MANRIEALDGIVPVVFGSREKAEAAMAELRELGFADDEMGVIVPELARHHLMDDAQVETLKGLGQGVVVGAPLGAIAGIALASLVAPGVGAIGVGGALLFGAHVGGLWGTITGAYLGLTTEVHHLEDIARKYRIELKPEEILVVVVTDESRASEVCDICQRHDARCIRDLVEKSEEEIQLGRPAFGYGAP